MRSDWAVQNKHLEIVKILLDGIPDIDVLAQNGFGRGCVTEAFQCEDTEIRTCLPARQPTQYEHKRLTLRVTNIYSCRAAGA